jgi:cobalt-precorrin-5B (C1)-methyltransferase
MVLCGQAVPQTIDVALPDGTRAALAVLSAKTCGDSAEAAVRKDAGDDPDVTDGKTIIARVRWTDGNEIAFAAGEGVGTVTRPGLSVPPGEPAINPVPRAMIRQAVREVTGRGLHVTLSIPGGREIAEKTFNPRLGIVGGLSILGTTGRVRPFSHPALQAALKCGIDVAVACAINAPVLVPGHIGERSARRHFELRPEQVVEVSNEWGFMLDLAARAPFEHILIVGHPGKLAKLAEGEWDTHSSRSINAVAPVMTLAQNVLGREIAETPTVEGLFDALGLDERRLVANALAERIRRRVEDFVQAIEKRARGTAVVLINMQTEWLGSSGELSAWRRK